MRFSRVPGVSNQPDDLTALHLVAGFDTKAAGLQMCVKGISPLTEIDNHVIAANGFQRYRHGARRCPGNVLRNAVLCRDDNAVGYRKRFGAVGSIAIVLQLVAGPGLPIFAKLHPVNREALSNVSLTTDRNERPTMPGGIARSVGCQPFAAAQGRRDQERRTASHLCFSALAFYFDGLWFCPRFTAAGRRRNIHRGSDAMPQRRGHG